MDIKNSSSIECLTALVLDQPGDNYDPFRTFRNDNEILQGRSWAGSRCSASC
jgi:hypothetical protein